MSILFKLIIFNTIPMAYHRIKLGDPLPNNSSFSHQQSLSQHHDSKHKKKGSLYLKKQHPHHNPRLRTDEKEPSLVNPDPPKSHAASILLSRSKHSLTKGSKGKRVYPPKKKSKHTISVINLSKNLQERKGSSTATKRKQSQADFSDKIREKIEDFRVIATCLEEYSKQERKNQSEVNLTEILKMIGAFNRTEIGPLSKPLEKLIKEIVSSIQHCLPRLQTKTHKQELSFASPQKENNLARSVKNTVKKTEGSREHLLKKEEYPGEVNNLEENLDRLKYESNRLQHFLDEISSNNQNKSSCQEHSKVNRGKMEELQQLRSIAQEQANLIRELDASSEEGTFREDRH